LIWECEIRPAVAGRAYARNLKFEKREGRKGRLIVGDWGTGGSRKGREGRKAPTPGGVETERKIDCWRLERELLTPRPQRGLQRFESGNVRNPERGRGWI
jgi:hypothetical protein